VLAGALTTTKGMTSGAGRTLVYFQCDDCAIEESRVNDASGEALQSKRKVGSYDFIAICLDTEDNPFGLYSQA